MKALVGVLVLFALVGCASGSGSAQSGPASASGSVPGSGSASVSSPVRGSTSGAGCPRSVTITEVDGGASLCVALGGTVTVALRGVPGQPWRPVAAQGDSLSQGTAPSAPADATSAGFVAVRPGIATVTSSRSACPPASPGSVSCKALQAFSVTVQVR